MMARKLTKTLSQIEEEMAVESTPIPKENKLVVLRRPDGLYYVEWSVTGTVPDVLKSNYTSMAVAENQIAKYEKSKEVVPYFWETGVKVNA